MPVRLEVRVIGTKQVSADLRRFSSRIRDWKPFWAQISKFLRLRIAQSFATQGAASGAGSWAPLSEKWAKRKAQIAPGSPILVLSSRMRDSFIQEGHPEHFERRSQSKFTFGSRVPYVGFHQEGGGWNIPRPILILTNADQEAITKTAVNFLRGRLVPQARSAITGRFI